MELTEKIKLINLGISIGKRLAEKEAAERQEDCRNLSEFDIEDSRGGEQ